LEEARKEISNRRYTAAFDILKEAEKVDPDAPQLRALLEKFTTAREQEQRRRELEQVTRQVEQAVNTDDNQSALNLVAEGLRKFPNDPSLLKLKDLAESQKQVAQTKSFVRERIAAAREILNAGNAAGALKVLEDALQKAPGNPHLESLVSIAQERLAQDRDEQAKTRCIQQANSALGRRAYAEAIQLLEAGQLRFASSNEIDNLLRFAREQRSKDTKQQEIENSARRAQELLRAQEYDRAIALLESILARVPDDELRIVLEEARRRRDDLDRQIEAAIAKGQQFLAEGSAAKALEFLRSQPTAYQRSEQFRELLQAARSQPAAEQESRIPSEEEWEAPPPSATVIWDRSTPADVAPHTPPRAHRAPSPRVQPSPAQPQKLPPQVRQLSKRQKLIIVAVAAGTLLVLIIVIAILWPSASFGTLSVRTNVDGVDVFIDDKPKGTIGSDHQMKISLSEGRHQVRLQKPGYDQPQPQPQTVDIVKNREALLPFDLSPTVPPMGTGTLVVQTNVDNVDVYVDSDVRRVTSGKQLQIALPATDHDIRVEKTNYNQLPTKRVHIDKDQTAAVPFTLTPMEASAGFLEIKAKPGAKVSVDQIVRGTVGILGTLKVQVKPANHLVEVTLDGYNPWEESRSVGQGQTLQVIVNLTLKPVPKQQIPVPTINFTATPDTVAAGQSATLNWQTTNASEVSIQGVGSNLQVSGSQPVKPTQTTTYILTAKGEGGSDTKRVTVTVPGLPTVSFSANPSTIQQSQSATLTWQTQNATQVSISGNPAVGLNGSLAVTPDKTTTFTIEAKGPGGTTNNAAVVTVQPKVFESPKTPGSDAVGIHEAIIRLQDAYASETIDEMVKAWPSIDKKQKEGVNLGFKRANALKVTYECADPSITGNTASINCTQTKTETRGGKRQPPESFPVAIGLKKVSNGWVIDSVRGR
jgi:hypothetical protein